MLGNIKILNLYYGNDVTNSIFVKGREELVLIDTGLKEKKEELLSEIKKYSFKKLYVILTHYHADHIGNNYSLRTKYDPIFIANTNSRRYLEDYEYHINSIIERAPDFPGTANIRGLLLGFLDKEIKINILFYKELIINIGNTKLEIISLPGHTDGSLGIIDKKNKLLILSELLFKHSREMIIYLEDFDKYIESLEKVKSIVEKYNIEYLITSHDEKPFKGNKEILNIVKFNADYINKLSSSVKKLHSKEYSKEEIAKEICKEYGKDYTLESLVTVKSILKN